MFGFLNSTILFAAAAALIPLIIHLFSRRRVKVIEFSSLKHLKEMQKRQLRRLKIRQLLLLLLRMLIILAVVLAFARPTSKEGEIGAHASVSAVILLDNSASMNRYVADGILFDIAKKRVADLTGTFSQSDEILIIPMDHSSGAIAEDFGTAAIAGEVLRRVAVGGGLADLQGSLKQAIELLEQADNFNKEIYLVTDAQRVSLPDLSLLEGLDYKFYLVQIPLEENDNVGIVRLDLGGQLIQPGHDFDIVATIHNYSSQSSTQKIASLFLNGQRVAQTDFEIEAGGETSVRFTRSVSTTGFHSGYVEISDDKFALDNRQFFSMSIPEKFNLLIIDGDNSAKYLSLALVPPASGGQYWSVKEAKPNELVGVNFDDYDVVILAGAPVLQASYNSRLKSYVDRGKSLFITYGGETDIDNFNRNWAEIAGVRYTSPVKKEFSKAGYYTFRTVESNHPIFSIFNLNDNKPPEIKFYSLPKLEISDDANTLLTFTGDQSALVENKFGTGRLLTFTGPISPKYSDMVSHAFFVPFVARIGEYLAADLSGFDLNLYAGKSVTRNLAVTDSYIQSVDLILPDSSIRSVPPEEDGGVLLIRTGLLSQPGIYRVMKRGTEIDRFAVNIDPLESDLTAVDDDQLIRSIGIKDYHHLQIGDNLVDTIAGFRVGRELWQLFLWLAALFLVLEMLLGRQSATEE